MKKIYETYISQLAFQAKEMIPNNISPEDAKYIEKVVYNFTIISFETLQKDDNLEENHVYIISRLIAQWTFHKAIDIIHANINYARRDEILKDIAFVVFEISKQAALSNLSIEQIEELAEHHANKKFREMIYESYAKGEITKIQKETALLEAHVNSFSMFRKDTEEDDDDNFYDEDIFLNKNMDKEILKATKIDTQMRKLSFKYLLKASHALKHSNVGDKRRRLILKKLAYYTNKTIEYFNIEEYKIKEKEIYKILTLSMQIMFSKIVILSYSGINKNLWENILPFVVENIYINSIYNAKRKISFRRYYGYIKIWAHTRFMDQIQEGADYGAITKNQIKNAKKKCNINYLNDEIDKMVGIVSIQNILLLTLLSSWVLFFITKVIIMAIL